MSDDAKKIVLARRARFVAAALAGMSIACGKEKAPQPCLDVPPDESAISPMVCLTATITQPTPPPPDASPDAASTTPKPCLTVSPRSPPPPPPPPPRSDASAPRPCLDVNSPWDPPDRKDDRR